MAFLNPLLLFGCAAIAAPIIIHLLSRRTVKRITWAAMRFLQASIQQQQRRLNIEDILLLLLRCLILIFLALALARPTLRNAAAGFGQPVTAVVALDNSYSMSTTDGVSSRFDLAKQAAEQVVDSLPSGSSVAVLLVSDVARGAIPVPTSDRNLARKIIRAAPLTDRGTDWLPGLRMALETLEHHGGGRQEIDVITDGQASGWRQADEVRSLLHDSREKVAVRLIFVGEPENRNVGVSGLRSAGALATVGQPLRFEVEVTNFGTEEAANVAVNLAADDEAPQDTTTIDKLPVGGTRSVSLFAKLRSDGYHTVTARTTPDHLPADDARTVALHVLKQMTVLLVDGNPGNTPRESATFFLRNALVPVPAAEQERYFLKTKVVSANELDTVRLSEFETVIMADVIDLPARTLEELSTYLKRGGGLMIFPGPHSNAAFYNKELLNRYHFLPAALGDPHGEADAQNSTGFTVQVTRYEHPLVSIWNDPAAGTLGTARFYRAFKLEPAPPIPHPANVEAAKDPAGDPQTVLRFADGSPMLMERPWGAGRVLLFASTANTAWNDLPVRPAFLPLLYRALGSIVGRQDERFNVPVGGRFVLPVEADSLGKEATVTPPQLTVIPEGKNKPEEFHDQRSVEMVNGTATVQYDDTDLAGAYGVSVPGEGGGGAYRFAVQPDTRESQLAELTTAQIEGLAPAKMVRWTPATNLKDAAEGERRGAEFWLPLALLALTCAVAEMLLADWFSRSR